MTDKMPPLQPTLITVITTRVMSVKPDGSTQLVSETVRVELPK